MCQGVSYHNRASGFDFDQPLDQNQGIFSATYLVLLRTQDLAEVPTIMPLASLQSLGAGEGRGDEIPKVGVWAHFFLAGRKFSEQIFSGPKMGPENEPLQTTPSTARIGPKFCRCS